MKDYDDQDAIDFILAHLPAEIAAKYSPDAIQYFIDALFDCYESAGMLDIDLDEDPDVADSKERNSIIESLVRTLPNDKHFTFACADIPLLVDAERDYENSLL